MHYGAIKSYDIANGPGVRVTIFVSGCTHHCKNCFQPETWDFNYGEEYTDAVTEEIIEYMKPPYIKGLTLLGGDPMEKVNMIGLLPLLRRVKEVYPKKDIWCFTGYDYEIDVLGRMINEIPETKEFLSYIDILVDGEFMEEKKSLMLKFKGSSNQKTIDIKRSLKEGRTVLLEGYEGERNATGRRAD